MNGLPEGYKRAVDQNWGGMAKIGFSAKKRDFGSLKKLTSCWTLCSSYDRKKLFKEKSCPFPNKYQSLKKFVFFWDKMHFWPKKHFSAEKTAVSP